MLENIQIQDVDRDGLAVLPLSMIPLETKVLQDFRLVKNNHMESVVELFNDVHAGKGHVHPSNLRKEFSNISSDDVAIVEKLSVLHSYDVYSLRISLREMGIAVNESEHLQLSEGKQKELQAYMQPFIKRLILHIYGDADALDGDIDLTRMLQDPDVQVVRQHLVTISDKLNIELQDVPLFLEEYGDIYLSIAYYRQCLERIDKAIENFLYCIRRITDNNQLQQNRELMKVATRLQKKVEKIREVLIDRFDVFAHSTNAMWADMSAEKFGVFKKLVEDNHAALGGLLCTLSVKMTDWDTKFPTTTTSGPMRWADHIMTDMRQGF